MTDATEPRFDPRHDPLFQRGYDPAVPRVSTQPVAAQPAGTEHVAAPPIAARPGSTQPGSTHPGSTEPDSTEPDSVQPVGPRRVNPYIRALWIVGIGLVVGGLALVWQATSNNAYNNYSADDVTLAMLLQQLAWVVIPVMLTVGTATIVALVFWEAAHWRAPGQPTE
jgi:hypothetical protein